MSEPEIAATMTPTAHDAADGSPTRQQIVEWLTRRVAEQLGASPESIDPDGDVAELGLDSMSLYNMTGDLAQWLNREIQATMFWDHQTIASIADALAGDAAPRHWRYVLPLRESGDRPPLLCVPGMSGHPIAFRGLASQLDSNQPVYGLALTPLGTDEHDAATTVESIARCMAEEVNEALPTGPLRVAGYSFGGIFAYELARQLIHAGRTVDTLMFDGFPRPARLKPIPHRIVAHLKRLWRLPTDEKLAYLRKRGQRLHQRLARRSDRDRDADNLDFRDQLSQNAKQRNFNRLRQIWIDHRPGRFPGRITLFRAELPGHWAEFHRLDPLYGWGELADGGVEVIDVPVPHRRMADHPEVLKLAAALRPVLER